MSNRICKKCGGLVFRGERCPCASVRPHYAPAPSGSLEAAHFYHLIKSIRGGSWAKTGYKTAYNPEREAKCALYSAFSGGGFHMGRRRVYRPFIDVQFFVFRCEVSQTYWRNEWDGLMGNRLILWLGGCSKQTTCDYLQISRDSLKWLDREIRRYVRFPGRARGQNAEFLKGRHTRPSSGQHIRQGQKWSAVCAGGSSEQRQ